jgi:hypothetical protein
LRVGKDFNDRLDVIVGSQLEHETHIIASANRICREGQATKDEWQEFNAYNTVR